MLYQISDGASSNDLPKTTQPELEFTRPLALFEHISICGYLSDYRELICK